jgi:hypothetical protein
MRALEAAMLLAATLSACGDLPTYPTNDPDNLPPKERAGSYFESVTEGYFYPGDDTAQRRHEMGKTYRLLRLRSLMASSDEELTQKIDGWLIGEACDLAVACVFDKRRCPWETPKEEVVDRAVSSGWTRVRPLWKAWFDAKLKAFDATEEDRLASCAFSPNMAPIPDFDRYAFGLRVIDEWEASGRPGARSAIAGKPLLPDDGSMLPARFSDVVAPRWVPHTRHAVGDPGFYRFALSDPDRTFPFLRALLARKDPLLLEKALGAVEDARALEMLRAFKDDAGSWTALFGAYAKTAVPSRPAH